MKRIVFCDFDGTITVAETFVAMTTRFALEMSQYGSIKQIPFLVLVRVDRSCNCLRTARSHRQRRTRNTLDSNTIRLRLSASNGNSFGNSHLG